MQLDLGTREIRGTGCSEGYRPQHFLFGRNLGPLPLALTRVFLSASQGICVAYLSSRLALPAPVVWCVCDYSPVFSVCPVHCSHNTTQTRGPVPRTASTCGTGGLRFTRGERQKRGRGRVRNGRLGVRTSFPCLSVVNVTVLSCLACLVSSQTSLCEPAIRVRSSRYERG